MIVMLCNWYIICKDVYVYGCVSVGLSVFYVLFGFFVIFCWLVIKVKRLFGVKKKLRYKCNIMYICRFYVSDVLFVFYDLFVRKNFKVIGINWKYEF